MRVAFIRGSSAPKGVGAPVLGTAEAADAAEKAAAIYRRAVMPALPFINLIRAASARAKEIRHD